MVATSRVISLHIGANTMALFLKYAPKLRVQDHLVQEEQSLF